MGDSAQPRASHFEGDRSQPLIDETIGDAFQAVVKLHGERIALVVRHQRVRWTYRELEGHVNDLAAGLLRTGLRPGDRIGIWAPNCVEWTVTQYATAKIGLVLVNLNSAYRAAEIKYALTKVRLQGLGVRPSIPGNAIPRPVTFNHSGDRFIASRQPSRCGYAPKSGYLICITDESQSGVHRFCDIATSGRMHWRTALLNGLTICIPPIPSTSSSRAELPGPLRPPHSAIVGC